MAQESSRNTTTEEKQPRSQNKKLLAQVKKAIQTKGIAIIAVFVVMLMLTLAVVQQRQELRQRAEGLTPEQLAEQGLIPGENVTFGTIILGEAPDGVIPFPDNCDITVKDGATLTVTPEEIGAGESITAKITFTTNNCPTGGEALRLVAIHNENPENQLEAAEAIKPVASGTDFAIEATLKTNEDSPTGEWTAYIVPNVPGTPLAGLIERFGEAASATFTIGNPTCSEANLKVTTPLELDDTSVTVGETVTGSITYTNSGGACNVGEIGLSYVRPDGEIGNFSAQSGETTIEAGATKEITGSYTVLAADPAGTWGVYGTFQSMQDPNAWVSDLAGGKTFEVTAPTDNPQPGNDVEEDPAGACETTATDAIGKCATGRSCNTAFDKVCTGGICKGVCVNNPTEGKAPGAACTTKKQTNGVDAPGHDGFFGDCGTHDLICYTAPDLSDDCKMNGNCAGTCRAAYPGSLPDEPCKKANDADWQGGCVNGQHCETPTGSLEGVCKPGGQAGAAAPAAPQVPASTQPGGATGPIPQGQSCAARPNDCEQINGLQIGCQDFNGGKVCLQKNLPQMAQCFVTSQCATTGYPNALACLLWYDGASRCVQSNIPTGDGTNVCNIPQQCRSGQCRGTCQGAEPLPFDPE